MTALRKITPTSRAPYRLRFLTADFPAEGAIVVEWRYRFSRNDYEAVVRRLTSGRVEHHIAVAGVTIPSGEWTDERAEELADLLIKELEASS